MPDEKKRVLLIEDEEDLRTIYAEVLREAGYDVIEAQDGEAGLALALDNKWDLILLDIMIPKLDGYSLLGKLKDFGGIEDKPVILLTNMGDEHLITQCFDLGATGYLIKAQITPDKIVNEVKNYV